MLEIQSHTRPVPADDLARNLVTAHPDHNGKHPYDWLSPFSAAHRNVLFAFRQGASDEHAELCTKAAKP